MFQDEFEEIHNCSVRKNCLIVISIDENLMRGKQDKINLDRHDRNPIDGRGRGEY